MASEAQRRANRAWKKRNREKIAAHNRKRYAEDAEYREKCRASSRSYYNNLTAEDKAAHNDAVRERYANDDAYREKMRKKSLDWYHKNKAKEREDV